MGGRKRTGGRKYASTGVQPNLFVSARLDSPASWGDFGVLCMFIILVILQGLLFWGGLSANTIPRIAPELQEVMQKAKSNQMPDEMLPVIIKLEPLAELKDQPSHPGSQTREEFILTLQKRAKQSQKAILNFLKARKKVGRANKIRPLWITNSISVETTPDVIEDLERRDDVLRIILDQAIATPSLSPPEGEEEEESL